MYQSRDPGGPEPFPHPSSPDWEGAGELGTTEHPTQEICSGSTNLLYLVLWRISGVGKLRQALILRKTEIPATCGTQGFTYGCSATKERWAV